MAMTCTTRRQLQIGFHEREPNRQLAVSAAVDDRHGPRGDVRRGQLDRTTLQAIAFVLPVLAAGTTAQTIQDFLKARIPLWKAPAEPFRMLGNIHYVGTNGLAIYLITRRKDTSDPGFLKRRRRSRAASQSSTVCWNIRPRSGLNSGPMPPG